MRRNNIADRYWVGGTADWNGTAASKWATSSGGAGGASEPGTGDNVFFDAASGTVTVTVTGGVNCQDITFTGFTGTLAGTATIAIWGSIVMDPGMNLTHSGTKHLRTNSTGKTITSNGDTWPGLFQIQGIGGAGETTLQDAFTCGSIDLLESKIDFNDMTVTLTSTLTITGTATRAIDFGASTVYLTTITVASTTGLTWTEGTSHIISSTDTGSPMEIRTLNFYDYTNTGSNSSDFGATIWAAGGHNLTRTNTASYAGINFLTDMTISNNLTITGNTANTRRICVRPNSQGNLITLTVNGTVSIDNADLWFIKGAGSASWDLSANSVGNLGDCQDITFPTAKDCYWIGNGGNWTDTAHWSASSGGSAGGGIPLAHDDVFFDANSFSSGSQTVTIDVAGIRIGKNVDWTGATNSPGWTRNNRWWATGSITLISAMTLTNTSGGSPMLTPSTGETMTLTSAGKTMSGSTELGGLGTISLADTYTVASSTNQRGAILDLNGQTWKTNTFNSSSTVTRTITSSSSGGIIECTSTGTVYTISNSTNLTINNASNITIKLSSSSASSRTVTGNTSFDIGHLQVTAGSGALTLTNTRNHSWDFTGYTGALGSGTHTVYGDITISANTFTSGTGVLTLGAGNGNIDFNGVQFNRPITLNASSGTKTLLDNIDMGGASTRTFTWTDGDISFGSYTITANDVSSSNSNTRAADWGTGGFIVTGTGTVWNMATATNFTSTNAATGFIRFTNSSTSSKTFAGGGSTQYPTLQVRTGNTGVTIITGSNTFYGIERGGANSRIIHFTAGTTTTIGAGLITTIGATTGHTITSATASNHTLTKASGTITCTETTISRSTATGGATWNALTTDGNVDGGNNSGWIFVTSTIEEVTYTGNGRIALVEQVTKTGNSRINVVDSITKTGNSRITLTDAITKTGEAIVAIVSMATKTGDARVSIPKQTTKNSNARINKTQQTTKTGNARILKSAQTTKTGQARILLQGLITKFGNSRINTSNQITKSGNSRVLVERAISKPGNSRVSVPLAITKTGNARITATKGVTKIGNSRVNKVNGITKPGNSRIAIAYSTNKSGNAKILVQDSITKTGNARLLVAQQIAKSSNSRINKAQEITKSGNSRIAVPGILTKGGNSRITLTSQATKSSNARIERTNTTPKTGNSRISIIREITKTGNSRVNILNQITKSGDARLKDTRQVTKTGNTRISITGSVNRTGNAKVLIRDSITKTGNARLSLAAQKTYNGTSRITKTQQATKSGNARINLVDSITKTGEGYILISSGFNKSGNARILKSQEATKSGNATISFIEAITKSGNARILKEGTKSSTGNARILKEQIATKVGEAFISTAGTILKTGVARILKQSTTTKTGNSRVSKRYATTRGGNSRVLKEGAAVKTGTGRVLKGSTKAYTGTSRINRQYSTTKSGNARLSLVDTVTKSGNARVSVSASTTKLGNAALLKTMTATRTGNASIEIPVGFSKNGRAIVNKVFRTTKNANAAIEGRNYHIKEGNARIRITDAQYSPLRNAKGTLSTNYPSGRTVTPRVRGSRADVGISGKLLI